MSGKMATRPTLLCAIAVGLLSGSTGQQEARGEKIHFVLAADVGAPGIGQDMEINRETLKSAIILNTPKEMCNLVVLRPGSITAQGITQAISGLRSDPSDSVMFYYGGHGAYDPKYGTYLLASADRGRGLYLSTIRKSVEAKGMHFGLVVLDCCNRVKPLNGVPVVSAPVPIHPERISPLFNSLFLRPVGTVSIVSSAGGEYALVYPTLNGSHRGSLYTMTFANILVTDRDRAWTWNQLVAKNQRMLDVEFRSVCRTGAIPLGNGQMVPQARQTIVSR